VNPETVIDAVSAVFMVIGALMSLAAAIGLLLSAIGIFRFKPSASGV